jgi:hypothetical protein
MSYITIAGTGGGSGPLAINVTPITGATGAILWDDAGTLQEIAIGPGLSFSGGTLSATGAITINSTPILGGTSPLVLYDNAGTVGEAANFSIVTGNPNVTSGAYMMQGIPGLYVVPNVSGNNWFEGGSGNFAVSGEGNFGTGDGALAAIASGYDNAAVGHNACHAMTIGHGNSAIGNGALQSNIDGVNNTAVGTAALAFSQHDSYNTAIGPAAGESCNGGQSNVFIGSFTGQGVTTGNQNTFIGGEQVALTCVNGTFNVCIGAFADVSTAGALGEMSIGNLLFGQNLNNPGPIGWIGVATRTSYRGERFGVNGTICTNAAAFLIQTNTAYTNGAGTGTGVTFTNAPGSSVTTGNPTKWIPIDDAGTTRYIPAF